MKNFQKRKECNPHFHIEIDVRIQRNLTANVKFKEVRVQHQDEVIRIESRYL